MTNLVRMVVVFLILCCLCFGQVDQPKAPETLNVIITGTSGEFMSFAKMVTSQLLEWQSRKKTNKETVQASQANIVIKEMSNAYGDISVLIHGIKKLEEGKFDIHQKAIGIPKKNGPEEAARYIIHAIGVTLGLELKELPLPARGSKAD